MAASCFPRSIFPVRLYLVPDRCKKSSLYTFFENALEKFRTIYSKKSTLSTENFRPQHRIPAEFFSKDYNFKAPARKFHFYRPGSIQNLASRWVPNSLAAAAGREWRRRMLQRGKGPMLCFVGFVLAKQPSILTQDEERESVSYLIRESFSTIPWSKIGMNLDKDHECNRSFSLADIEIGNMIAKGCNAAVYSACLTNKKAPVEEVNPNFEISAKSIISVNHHDNAHDSSSDHLTEERNKLLTYSRLIISHAEGEEMNKADHPKTLENTLDKFDPYNLAVKVMFNYNAASNAYVIWSAMKKETLPCMKEFCFNESKLGRVRRKQWRPHPNIVEMYFAFADQLPLLPGAYEAYPQALPVRLLSEGCGRNMTLFLVMKRYHCSLREYLQRQEEPSPRTRLLLLAQLLEALVHLQQSEVAHRDLKADNVLLDLAAGSDAPRLAVTDFGCCLESLSLPYPSPEISKGGNVAMMPPEVASAEAGPLSRIDYSRADLWAAGALAYEIFGAESPPRPDSPPLFPPATPPAVRRLVEDMLRTDPKQRPRPSLAATVCQLLLHAPADLPLQAGGRPLLEWMCLLSARARLEGASPRPPATPEFELRHTLCSRLQYGELAAAARYIRESPEQPL